MSETPKGLGLRYCEDDRLTAALYAAERASSPAVPAETAQPATAAWGEFFVPCEPCVTKTHCGQHRRCLAECTPADLVPPVRETPPAAPTRCTHGVWLGDHCYKCGGDNNAWEGVPPAAPNLADYLSRQIEWSRRTFGEGKRTLGVTAHIGKELDEIRQKPDDLSEWVDVIILAMDGYWRHGGTPNTLMRDLQAKQDKNVARKWPAPTSEDVPVEHDRSADVAPPATTADLRAKVEALPRWTPHMVTGRSGGLEPRTTATMRLTGRSDAYVRLSDVLALLAKEAR